MVVVTGWDRPDRFPISGCFLRYLCYLLLKFLVPGFSKYAAPSASAIAFAIAKAPADVLAGQVGGQERLNYG
jgi:hypothetical protein